jgi:hypothetical protein
MPDPDPWAQNERKNVLFSTFISFLKTLNKFSTKVWILVEKILLKIAEKCSKAVDILIVRYL